MTEKELNRQIEISELQRAELLPQMGKCRTGRAYRRVKKKQKFERLYTIVTSSYVPHAGYVVSEYIDGHYIPVGAYIKYPKNSKSQRVYKRETSKRQRKCLDLPHRGNGYRRLFDSWWALY